MSDTTDRYGRPAAGEAAGEAAPDDDATEAEVLEGEIEEPADRGQDATDGGGEEEVADAELAEEAPESELAAARRERDQYLDLAQRARAELDNYRRRVKGETASAEQRGRASVARELFSAIDNLELALQSVDVDPEGAPPADEPASEEVSAKTALAEGVALVYRELREGLKRAGVEPFDPTGESFDANSCEAVATAQADGAGKDEVVEVLAKGYRIGDQVLRPARVVVSG
jgi:molecular chaperone GrpE